ncbi:exodeoxyribonuclease III [Chloroflexota bacterium]
MKIISWNVNGLRALLSKSALNDVKKHNPEVLCLQEIKVKQEQLSDEQVGEFTGYYDFWNSAQRPGYSGVATFSQELPDFNTASLGDERFDVEGRAMRTDFEGITLFNIYVPNGQRDQTRLEYKLDFYASLLEICDDLHDAGKQIIICGDINTAHQPIDLRNPKQNEKTSGFLPEERAWIDKYLEHEFIDIYREIYGERVQYTWWTYRVNARQRNIGWRLDYFLISKDLIDNVKDVIIYDEIEGSDHCPIGLDIRI